MATNAATRSRAEIAARRRAREIPQHVSPGLWTLAWRRLRRDHVGMVSLAIVAAFIVMMILSGTGLIAKDWAREVGVNYAPPTFVGSPTTRVAARATAAPASCRAARRRPQRDSSRRSSIRSPT